MSAFGFITLVVSLCFFGADAAVVRSEGATLPPPNGRLNNYMLPVGQGDAQVIQCPNGDLTVFDMGSSDDPPSRFWRGSEIKKFFGDQIDDVINVFITHGHWDHYSLLPDVFETKGGIQNIYVSCTKSAIPGKVKGWLSSTRTWDLVRTFNDGAPCGPKGGPCERVTICPKDREIESTILAANLGESCGNDGNRNTNSIVLKLKYKDFVLMHNGDFEDHESDWKEEGPQKMMVDFYGDELVSTVYHVAHHGSSYKANKPIWRDAIKPKAVFSSSNPWYGFRHPRCVVFDGFIKYVRSLCKPEVIDPSDEFYCGEKINDDQDFVQSFYTCGTYSKLEERMLNEFAIYTSVPDEKHLNLVSVTTDGYRWQFKVQDATLN